MVLEFHEEWDGPWKEALDFLMLVLALFWADVLRELDLDKGMIPLEQELQKLTSDSSTRLLRVDKLFELTARDSGDPRFAHFEAQMQRDDDLPGRMFHYNRRAGEHYNQPVGSFAILGDDDPNWKPTSYREGVFGCEQTITFRVVKLLEWRPRMAELEAGENLFGLFVCAHLETMSSRGDVPTRLESKVRLLTNLMRREIRDDEFRCWYRLIDWIMKLPEDANRIVWQRLEALKEPKAMSHVTFAEKYGHEKGLKEGRTEGLRASLRKLVLAKFPQHGPALIAEFDSEMNPDRLDALLQAAGLATSPDDFHAQITSSS